MKDAILEHNLTDSARKSVLADWFESSALTPMAGAGERVLVLTSADKALIAAALRREAH